MSTGQHELPQDAFDDVIAEKGAVAQTIDLKSLLPDLFINTSRVPRLVAQAWRSVADAALQETAGVYTYRGGTVIEIVFYLLPPAIARIRTQDIGAQIKAVLAHLKESPDAGFAAAAPKPAAKTLLFKGLVEQLESEIQKLNRDGLGVNPGDEMVRLWAARVMHDLYHDRRSIPLLPQMMELVAQVDISYLPFFDAETRGIGGSFSVVSSPLPPDKYNTGEILRQDMSALFSAAVQLYYLRAHGREGMVVMPVRVKTLADYDIAGLYTNFLSRLAPEISACLAVEVTGLSRDAAPVAVAESIHAISNGLRSCFFNMGAPAAQPGFHNPVAQFPTLHACGFSCAAAGAGWQRKAEKFVAHYRGLGLKTYLTDVSQPNDAEAAKAIGFTYVAGAAFGGSQRVPFSLNKIV